VLEDASEAKPELAKADEDVRDFSLRPFPMVDFVGSAFPLPAGRLFIVSPFLLTSAS